MNRSCIISNWSLWSTGWLWWSPYLQRQIGGHCLLGHQLCKPILPWSLHQSEELRQVDQLDYQQWQSMNTVLDEEPVHSRYLQCPFFFITNNFLCVYRTKCPRYTLSLFHFIMLGLLIEPDLSCLDMKFPKSMFKMIDFHSSIALKWGKEINLLLLSSLLVVGAVVDVVAKMFKLHWWVEREDMA